MDVSETINKIKDIIVTNYDPDKIILFGSFALGNPSENSDLDIMVVKNSKLPRYKRGSEVRKLLRGILFPMDILVYTNEEIEEDKDLKYSLVYEVLNTGKLLYEKK